MEDKNTAAFQGVRRNIRHERAQRLGVALINKLDRYIPDDCRYRAISAISELLMTEGVEIITDADRAQAGLPPRGPEGWTAAELAVLEQARLEIIARPLGMTIQKEPK